MILKIFIAVLMAWFAIVIMPTVYLKYAKKLEAEAEAKINKHNYG